MKVPSIIVLSILTILVSNEICSYTIFNRSSDSSDRISALAFKDEKSAMQFFYDLGWTHEVAKVADKVAVAATVATGALAAPFSAIIIGSTKIAEAAILDKILHKHPLMFTPIEHKEKIEILEDDLAQAIADNKETIAYKYEEKINNSKSESQKKKLRAERDERTKKMVEKATEKAEQQKLDFSTGSMWWWKEIEDKHKNVANPYVILMRTPERSKSILTVDPFEEWQAGAKVSGWEIIGAGYLNRGAILVYNGEDKANTVYFPFLKRGSRIKDQNLAYNKIIWKKLEEGEKQRFNVYQAMTGSSLDEIKDYFYANDITKAKKFDHGLSLFFKNFSDHPVHVMFVREQDLATIFEAGGWTKKSMEALAKLTKIIGAVAADAAVEVATEGASTLLPIEPGELVGLTVDLVERMAGDLPEKVTTAIAVESIKPLDYFKNIFPGALRYSYFSNKVPGVGINRSSSASKTSFLRTGDTDLVMTIFPSIDNKADLSAPEYVGNFDRKNFNGVYYWQKPGEVKYLKYDPVKGQVINEVAAIAAVPVDRDGDDIILTEDGQEVVEDLLKETKGKVTAETRRSLEDLLD